MLDIDDKTVDTVAPRLRNGEAARAPRKKSPNWIAVLSVTALGVLLTAAAVLVVILVTSQSHRATIADEPLLYEDLTNPATISAEAQHVFDDIVQSSLDADTSATTFLPWESADVCADVVLMSAVTAPTPNLPGPYLGEGIVMLRIDFPTADSTRVRFYLCTPS